MDQVCFLTALFDTGSNPGLFADILHCVGVLAAYIIPCKHKVKAKHTDGKKSWEGSTAMLVVSFLCGLCMLVLSQPMPIPKAAAIALIAALLGTVTELFSPSEYDTVTVPTVIAAALLLLI